MFIPPIMVTQLRATIDGMSDAELDAMLYDLARQAGPDNEPMLRRAAASLYRVAGPGGLLAAHEDAPAGQTVQVGTIVGGVLYGAIRPADVMPHVLAFDDDEEGIYRVQGPYPSAPVAQAVADAMLMSGGPYPTVVPLTPAGDQ